MFPVLVALLQWGDKWEMGGAGAPIRLLEHDTGAPLEPVGPYSSSGRLLGIRDVRMETGPGETASTAKVVALRNRTILGTDGKQEWPPSLSAAKALPPARKSRAGK